MQRGLEVFGIGVLAEVIARTENCVAAVEDGQSFGVDLRVGAEDGGIGASGYDLAEFEGAREGEDVGVDERAEFARKSREKEAFAVAVGSHADCNTGRQCQCVARQQDARGIEFGLLVELGGWKLQGVIGDEMQADAHAQPSPRHADGDWSHLDAQASILTSIVCVFGALAPCQYCCCRRLCPLPPTIGQRRGGDAIH